MTKPELLKTIEYLKRLVWHMEDREDGERLREPIDRLKDEIKILEERRDAL